MSIWSDFDPSSLPKTLPGTARPFDPVVRFENQRVPYTVTDGFTVHNDGATSITNHPQYGQIKTQSPNSHFEQIALLTEDQKSFIVKDRYKLTAAFSMRSSPNDSDKGCMAIVYYDVDGTAVGSTVRAYDNYAAVGEQFTLTSWIPRTTVKIGFNWYHQRLTGSENSVYVGNFRGWMERDLINKASILYANCGTDVENSEGAVDDIANWVMTTGQVFYSTATGIYNLNTVRGGTNDAITQGYQEFAANPQQLDAIAVGSATLLLDCHLNSENQDDKIRASIQGLDDANTVLIELETSANPADHNDQGQMISIQSGVVPPLVTKFRIIFDAERVDGTANDAGMAYATARLEYASDSFADMVYPTGIPSEEAVSTGAVLDQDVILLPAGIASAEAFGTAVVDDGLLDIAPTGIASAEAFGTAQVLDTGLYFPNATVPYTATTSFTVHNGNALIIRGDDWLMTDSDGSHFEQEYSLSTGQKAVVAGGRVKLTASFDMSGFGSDTDNGALAVVYYDSDGDVVGTAVREYTDYADEPTGETVTIESWMPAATDKVGYNWFHKRVTGTNNNSHVGTFTGVMDVDTVDDHTIIYANGGTDAAGEQGAVDDISSWTVTSGALFAGTSTGLYNLNVVRGGSNHDICQAYREFTASSKELTAIATGTATLLLDVHLNNTNNDDRIRASVQGLNASDVVKIELETSASPVDHNAKGEMFSLQSGIIPSDVTKFRIIFDADRFDGSANDAALSYITARVDYEV